jgi:hypothetical protein
MERQVFAGCLDFVTKIAKKSTEHVCNSEHSGLMATSSTEPQKMAMGMRLNREGPRQAAEHAWAAPNITRGLMFDS